MTTSELLHIRDRSGRCVGYLVPSTSEPGVFHTVTPRWCDCRGFQYRNHCHHVEQVREYVESKRPPMPAAALIVGLRSMVDQRGRKD